ncbi:MAG TPA: hypothetical protein VJI15_03265 [Candidatus Nanoarchaeia archaeon]|nr:hypothetical protein [Candidatus Nanoarchaeia archaeon]
MTKKNISQKYLLWTILLLLVAGSALAASGKATEKVLVVTYDSTEEMLMDLGKVNDAVNRKADSDEQPDTTVKTWIYCRRYHCYEVPVTTIEVPVIMYSHAEPVAKYRYNKVDGQYINPWDEEEDYYRWKHSRKNWDDDRWWRYR